MLPIDLVIQGTILLKQKFLSASESSELVSLYEASVDRKNLRLSQRLSLFSGRCFFGKLDGKISNRAHSCSKCIEKNA